MLNIKNSIPNTITCANLFCGCLAIQNVLSSNPSYEYVAFLVLLACVLDFLDGLVARLLNAKSIIGKELDSLADMVTFGFLPGAILFSMGVGHWAWLIPVFSALRLAKFNVDTRQSDSFIGVPTPANALLICSLPLIKLWNHQLVDFDFLTSYFSLLIITVVMSFLMVVELPLISLKFKSLAWKENKFRFLLVIGTILLITSLGIDGVPLFMAYYVILSFIENMLKIKTL